MCLSFVHPSFAEVLNTCPKSDDQKIVFPWNFDKNSYDYEGYDMNNIFHQKLHPEEYKQTMENLKTAQK